MLRTYLALFSLGGRGGVGCAATDTNPLGCRDMNRRNALGESEKHGKRERGKSMNRHKAARGGKNMNRRKTARCHYEHKPRGVLLKDPFLVLQV